MRGRVARWNREQGIDGVCRRHLLSGYRALIQRTEEAAEGGHASGYLPTRVVAEYDVEYDVTGQTPASAEMLITDLNCISIIRSSKVAG